VGRTPFWGLDIAVFVAFSMVEETVRAVGGFANSDTGVLASHLLGLVDSRRVTTL
jgi:hypothetical protein